MHNDLFEEIEKLQRTTCALKNAVERLVKSSATFVTKSDLKKIGSKIMATQNEQTAVAREQLAALTKIGAETDKLIQLVKDLEAAVGNQGDASPELVEAMAAVSAQLTVLDDKVPDQPA